MDATGAVLAASGQYWDMPSEAVADAEAFKRLSHLIADAEVRVQPEVSDAQAQDA